MGTIYFIMGVAGSGKTTIGKALAAHLQVKFIDADDEHPITNIEKMKAGIPLTDVDRLPWLQRVHARSIEMARTSGAVIACSALKQNYRELLQQHLVKFHWIFLDVEEAILEQRLAQRKDHYMPVGLLNSQLATLEKPRFALRINGAFTTDEIILQISQFLEMQNNQIGLVGLGVMGTALARNMAMKGWELSLYNRELAGKEELVAMKATHQYPELCNALSFNDLPAFVKSLGDVPIILMMLPAGVATDLMLHELALLLTAGSIIIDGANAFYSETEKWQKALKDKGIQLLGCGISGGKKGALEGPAMMIGGEKEAYNKVAPLLASIAAWNDSARACCNYICKGGSGHYVKMVHNAIEYGEMQLIAEIYNLLAKGLQMDDKKIAAIFREWNSGDLHSYLLTITIDILSTTHNDTAIVSLISDVAASKGTGSWATQEAAKLGVPSGMFTVALNARFLSSQQEIRAWVKQELDIKQKQNTLISLSIMQVESVYRLVRIWNHQQGFALIMAAAEEYGWDISLSSIADGWRAGCIIRSTLMDILADGFTTTTNLLNIDYCKQVLEKQYLSLVKLVTECVSAEIPIPIISEALQLMLQYKQRVLSTSLIQAQRDYFGMHGFTWRNDDTNSMQHYTWQE